MKQVTRKDSFATVENNVHLFYISRHHSITTEYDQSLDYVDDLQESSKEVMNSISDVHRDLRWVMQRKQDNSSIPIVDLQKYRREMESFVNDNFNNAEMVMVLMNYTFEIKKYIRNKEYNEQSTFLYMELLEEFLIRLGFDLGEYRTTISQWRVYEEIQSVVEQNKRKFPALSQ